MPLQPSTFRKEITNRESRYIIQKYIFDPLPFCFEKSPDLYWELRNDISYGLNVHIQDINIVGSAKLGFSPAKKKFGKSFDDSSDIDVLIVSSNLFDNIWQQLLKFEKTVRARSDAEEQKKLTSLKSCLFYGVLRLDKVSNNFNYAKEYWRLFNSLSKKEKYGPRRIRAAIYKSWHFAYDYYEKNIEELR